MAERQIDWASAEVKGGKLTAAISGAADGAKQWSARVQVVLRVLDRSGGKWGEIKVAKDKIQVSDLREGAEPDLRHLLESAVLQANADLASEDDEESDEREDGDDSDEEGRSCDQEMTDAFRSFASASDGEDQDEHADEKDKRDKEDGLDKKDKRDKREAGSS